MCVDSNKTFDISDDSERCDGSLVPLKYYQNIVDSAKVFATIPARKIAWESPPLLARVPMFNVFSQPASPVSRQTAGRDAGFSSTETACRRAIGPGPMERARE
jgi:hypothetical protein